MEWLVAFVTLVAGVVTIVWFIRDVRKENSKLLKAILDVQQRIEEGQRQGFTTLAEMLSNQTKLLENQTKILSDHTKIFERIAAKLG